LPCFATFPVSFANFEIKVLGRCGEIKIFNRKDRKGRKESADPTGLELYFRRAGATIKGVAIVAGGFDPCLTITIAFSGFSQDWV
jgi:hypothetical protein